MGVPFCTLAVGPHLRVLGAPHVPDGRPLMKGRLRSRGLIRPPCHVISLCERSLVECFISLFSTSCVGFCVSSLLAVITSVVSEPFMARFHIKEWGREEGKASTKCGAG